MYKWIGDARTKPLPNGMRCAQEPTHTKHSMIKFAAVADERTNIDECDEYDDDDAVADDDGSDATKSVRFLYNTCHINDR